MALTKCKECGKEISKKADTCPNCGFNQKKSKGKKWQAFGCLFWIFIIFLVFTWISNWEFSENTTPWNERDNSIMAYIMTEDWVKERLVSPATAEFPSASVKREHTTRLNNQRYRIESYVDSQNRMGATLRTFFTAEVQQTGETTWRLISIEMD